MQVRFGGLDRPAPGAPDFVKALDLDHARDGEVMVAFQMNGEQLPLLNGFPLRLVVPGWFSTYWIKALSAIEVMPRADDQYWMAKAYRIPTAPGGERRAGREGLPDRADQPDGAAQLDHQHRRRRDDRLDADHSAERDRDGRRPRRGAGRRVGGWRAQLGRGAAGAGSWPLQFPDLGGGTAAAARAGDPVGAVHQHGGGDAADDADLEPGRLSARQCRGRLR